MKTSKEILGSRIISVAEGTELGHIRDFVLNPQQGTLAFFIMDQVSDYFGAKIIAFSDILALGDFALTIPNSQVIQDVARNIEAEELLRQDIRVIGTKVLTEKGQFTGEVQEILFDEETGKIACCLYTNSEEEVTQINSRQVITYGKELLIIESERSAKSPSNILEKPLDITKEKSIVITSDRKDPISTVEDVEGGFNLFEQRQLQYFLNKQVEKDIILDSGETLFTGQQITQEMINKITTRSTLMEITSHLLKY
ncbi:MAG: PRC-barrel domain-containing protein [Desulfitobacteriaceae bacterium]